MLFVKPNIGQPHTSPKQHPILAVAIKVFNMQSIRITRLTASQILVGGFLNQAGQLSTQLHIKFEYHYTRLPSQEFCNNGQPLRHYNSFILLNLHSLHAGGSQCSSAMSSSSSGSVIAFAILAFRSITYLTDAADRASIIGLFILILLSHITTTLCVEKHVLPRQGRSWDWQAAYKMMWNGRWFRTGERGLDLDKNSPEDGTSFCENKCPVEFQHWTFLSEKCAKFSRRRNFFFSTGFVRLSQSTV